RTLTSIIVFLLFSGMAIGVTIQRYLIPAMAAAQGADSIARKQLSAISSLVLVVVLVSLLIMLILIFRPGRMFLQRRSGPRTQTKYVDAWAEAGRRVSSADLGAEDDAEEK